MTTTIEEQSAPEQARRGSSMVILAALGANVAITLGKLVAWLFTGSASMLAETLHSVADSGNQSLMLLGDRRGRRPADEHHPFGFGRERYFWAFIVALVLFSLGSLFALAEGVEKLRVPHRIDSPGWSIAVLLVAMVFEGSSLRVAVRNANPRRTGLSWLGFLRRTKNAELPVVLLEDSGALVGLSFALAGVVAAAVTGDSRYDAIGSLAIGLLLGVIAVFLAVEMKSLLVGEAGSRPSVERVEALLADASDVRSVASLRTLQLGPDDILVLVDVEIDGDLPVSEAWGVVRDLEDRVQREVPAATQLSIRPRPAR